MTAVAVPARHSGAALVIGQTLALARRSVVGTARQPAVWFPGMFFPLMIAAVNSSAMGRTTQLPGFYAPAGFLGQLLPNAVGVDSFLQFLLPATLIQGVLFGGIVAGADIALDIQDGFFDRLLASPVSRVSILLGRLSGAAVMGASQALLFIGIFTVFGAPIEGGLAAIAVLVLLGVVLAVAVGGWAATIGLRTGSQEAVQNSFPLVFILLFVSSAFFPTSLMSGWYRAVAENNPLSWMINGARTLVVDGYSTPAAVQALGVAAALGVVTVLLARRSLAWRLKVAA